MKIAQLIVSGLLVVAATLSHALEVKPYTAAALAEAEKANQPIALHFHADWCPTCRAQDKVVQALKAEKGLDLTILTVNYDTEKDLKRRFKVNSQSSLVVLRGQKETARLVGDATMDGIRGALKTAL
jgi:thioredoxin 1